VGKTGSGQNPGSQRQAATEHCCQSSLAWPGRGNPSQLWHLMLSSRRSSWKCPAPGDSGAREVTRGQDASGRPPSLAGKPYPRAAGPVGGKLFKGLGLCPRPFPLVPVMLEAGCTCPKSCGRTAGMAKGACLSGKHLKDKMGICLELQWRVATQREAEAQESGLVGLGGTGQLKRVDAQLPQACPLELSVRVVLGWWLVSRGLTQPIPSPRCCPVWPSCGASRGY